MDIGMKMYESNLNTLDSYCFFSFYQDKTIRNIRKNKGYTGKELAGQLNISQQQISRYERGVNQLTLDMLFNILIILIILIILDISLPSFINDLFDEVILNHPDNLDVVRLKIESLGSMFLMWTKKY